MANNNVKFFKVNLLDTYLNITTKDEHALYWVDENQTLYLGSKVYGTGQLASESAAGLLSPEDYTELKKLIATGGTVTNLVPIDGSIIIKDNTIDVGISAEPGNALTKKADGLYVGTSTSSNYAAGLGLQLVDGTFSVKLANITHGLVAVDGALQLNLATKDSDGAMSKEDKAFLDVLRDSSSSSGYVTRAELQQVQESVTQIEQSYVWAEM